MSMMKEIMERFSRLISEEMEKKNQSCVQFSELCGVGRNIVGDIINGKKEDVKLSTVVNICANSDIRIEDIFSITGDCGIETMLKNAYIVLEGKRYSIQLKKYSNHNTPPTQLNREGVSFC